MEMFFGFLVGTMLIAVSVCIYFVKKLSDKVEMIKADYGCFDDSLDRLWSHYYNLDMTVRKITEEGDDGK